MAYGQRDDPTQGPDSIGKAVRRNLSPGRIAHMFGRAFGTLFRQGPQQLWREVVYRYRLASGKDFWPYHADIPLRRETRAQKKKVFPFMPLISVIVPLYNTPLEYLRELLDSVRRQSYAEWELILVDGSDKGHAERQSLLRRYGDKDTRIRYTKLYKNAGIAGNTNLGIAESEGDYLLLLDHDDVLAPGALYEVAKAINDTGADMVYSDEAVLDSELKHLHAFHFKPDFGPDTLRGCNYITHLCAFSYHLLESIGGREREGFDGSQDYDLILRLSEKAKKIHHIPKVLYYWRRHENSTAKDILQKPEAVKAGQRALQEHLERVNLDGTVQVQEGYPGAYRVTYEVWGNPLVSILIPSSDHVEDLHRCIESIYERAGWHRFEVLVIDNNSKDPATESYYLDAEARHGTLRVLRYKGGFNFAAICNFGVARCAGDHILLLNNDIELMGEGFVREMLSYSQRPDVGAVGALLYYPDACVQHAGLFIGIGGTAGVNHKTHKRGSGGAMYRLCTTQNLSAVTGAALMVKRSLYEEVGGMDEEQFAVAFNDVDFCLKLREKGYWNVFTPFAEAWHFESKSRGYDEEGPAKERYDREAANFTGKYAALLEAGDPFYNPHLTLKFENYGLR
ncbi:glycosyltransferase family 2 protein [Ruminococcaceae bacterium OttesenSCG-928-I18]|nr:glycosyltransferase family 2 protein [Ruminococcaceae bacterium OttesenSCG-928-I18]